MLDLFSQMICVLPWLCKTKVTPKPKSKTVLMSRNKETLWNLQNLILILDILSKPGPLQTFSKAPEQGRKPTLNRKLHLP